MPTDRPRRRKRQADPQVELMQSLLHSIPDQVYRIHRSGHCVAAKPVRGDAFDPQRFLGQHIRDILPPAAAATGEQLIETALATGEVQLFEYSLPVDGRLCDREARIVACDDDHVLMLVRDTTERKRAEAMLLQMRLVESLGALSAGIAHIFNNRLMAILGQAELAGTELPAGSPVRQHITAIEQAARGASDLVKQIMAYSSGTGMAEPVALPHLLHELTPLLEQIAPRGVSLSLEIDSTVPAVVGDMEQLRQVVLMLAANAFESVGDAGQVSIRLARQAQYSADLALAESLTERPADDYVVLEVADDGPGIDGSTRARMFEPFYTSSARGGGVSLAVVLGIVHSHGGTIQVDSGPSHGTSVQVVFPPSPPSN